MRDRDRHQGRRGVVAAHGVGQGERDDAVVVEARRGVVGQPAAVGVGVLVAAELVGQNGPRGRPLDSARGRP